MKEKKFILGVFLIVLLGVLAYFVYAATLVQQWNVLSCNETDAGFDYLVQGTNFGYLNDTNSTFFNVSDYCISNTTLGEFVCGSTYGPQYANLAALYSEDCTQVPLNSTNNATICLNGRCV